jgi:hypothetical protein
MKEENIAGSDVRSGIHLRTSVRVQVRAKPYLGRKIVPFREVSRDTRNDHLGKPGMISPSCGQFAGEGDIPPAWDD